MMKKCSTCKEEKLFAEFNKSRNQKFGLHNQCRDCTKLWKPNSEALKKARKKTREWNRLKTTGFSPEDFQEKLAKQGGVCAICGTDNPGKLDFCADHDHKTGDKRGVLCRKCNTGLGHFNDDPEIIAKAIKYLTHYTR
jgi:Recombination endonuclease VII